MAKGPTNGGAGGSGKSSIIVSAPTGSIVYIEYQDGKRKDTGEKNGTWTFRGCDVGTWTIHASLDEQKANTVVEIKEIGQLMRYEVTIAYFAATINATYPEGSICTCSKDDVVFNAQNTSGFTTFIVAEIGDWLVSCTDGSKSTSKVATVTEDGQVHYIELRYEYHMPLDSHTWKHNVDGTGGTMTYGDNLISVYSHPATSAGGISVAITQQSYDLTQYTTLHAKLQIYDNNTNAILGIHNTPDGTWQNWVAAASATFLQNAIMEYVTDISAVQSGYIAVMCGSTLDTSGAWVNIHDVWLE